MKNALSCFVVIGLAWLSSVAFAATEPDSPRAPLTAKEIAQGYRDDVVFAKPLATVRAASESHEAREGLRVRRRWDRFGGLRLLEVPEGSSAQEFIQRLRASGRYEYVHTDSIRVAAVTPNDPSFNRQWPLANNGSPNGVAGADIDAAAAWDVRTDASAVIVAVIDSGVRLAHPDLAANLWRNPREIAGNGFDDDRNGFVDDVHGINAITNTGNPDDDDGHGTHVAGIIGAEGNNGVGISGVAWRVQIMALKFIRGGTGPNAGQGVTSDGIECIEYAIANGAHIINASYGVAVASPFNPAEYDAIRHARDAGIIFVAAAGNDGADMDLEPGYPAGFRLENIVAVANSTSRDDLPIGNTNYGSGSVELFAPGTEVYSLSNNATTLYTTLSGTSMSAPHVAGALALLKAQFPTDTYRQLINRVLRSVDPIPAFAGKVQTGGRLNLDRAIRSTDNRPFNDDFATRARVTGSTLAIRAVNTGATTEAEPAITGQAGGASLWWEWTAPSTSLARVTTDGSAYDTLVGVFTGSALNALTAVASNDDASGKTTSRLEFTAQAGATYQIVVASKNGGAGLTLLDIGAIPANDNFAAAATLTGRSALVESTNAQATLEPGEPQILDRLGGKSLWYRWTAPASGRFQFAATSDGFDPLLAIYTGNALNALTVVDANDDADETAGGTGNNTGALVTVNATAGTTYFIQLDGNARNGGPPVSARFVLTLNDTLWQGIAGNSVTSAPTIGPDGAVYVGSIDGYFHAFNANGSRRWAPINLGRAAQDTSAAAFAPNGTLYFGAGSSSSQPNSAKLFAYDSATGAKKWDITVGSGLNANNAVALGIDGTIYVHSDEGRLFAYTDTGSSATLKWSANIPGNSYASASVAADGTIYLGCDDTSASPVHRMFALNPADGSTKWTFVTDNPIYTSAAIDPTGNIYFGTLISGRLYSVAPAGAQRWVYRDATLGTSSSPALSPDATTVYFAGYDGILHAVNAVTGVARWKFKLGKEVRASSPAVDANGVVYVGCYDGLVYAVNPDGTLKRTWATGHIVRSSPAISNNTLYFGSNDSRIYALDIGAGSAPNWSQYRHNARRTGRAIPSTFAIVTPPQSQVAVLGLTLTLSVIASGDGPFTYVWKKDDAVIPGATQATYTVANVTAATAGRYTVTISGPQGSLTSPPAVVTVEPINPGRLINLSVRTGAGSGDQTLIVGFAITGSPEKVVLLRAIGPSLDQFGVTGMLPDPQLQLYTDAPSLLTTNDNWAVPASNAADAASTFTASGAFSLRLDSLDAAIIRPLAAGQYTVQVTAAPGSAVTTGIALAELYDTTPTTGARLVNVSARAQVGIGSEVLIAGFAISGNVPKRVLIRGIGPALAGFGVTGALANPQLDLFRGTTVLNSNDDWAGAAALSNAFTQVGAFPLENATSRDAALLVSLAPGTYTAQVSGVNNTTGVALVEVYEVP